jgi:hypothetical protein
MPKPLFVLLSITPETAWVRYLGEEKNPNGIVEMLGALIGSRQLFAIDGDGLIEEILIRDGKFAGIKA